MFLEKEHEEHMAEAIRRNIVTASLGGRSDRLSKVRAFIRVRNKEQGVLDFDVAGAASTGQIIGSSWWRIYVCLRSGFHAEALEAAGEDGEVSRSGFAREFRAALSNWIENKAPR